MESHPDEPEVILAGRGNGLAVTHGESCCFVLALVWKRQLRWSEQGVCSHGDMVC